MLAFCFKSALKTQSYFLGGASCKDVPPRGGGPPNRSHGEDGGKRCSGCCTLTKSHRPSFPKPVSPAAPAQVLSRPREDLPRNLPEVQPTSSRRPPRWAPPQLGVLPEAADPPLSRLVMKYPQGFVIKYPKNLSFLFFSFLFFSFLFFLSYLSDLYFLSFLSYLSFLSKLFFLFFLQR